MQIYHNSQEELSVANQKDATDLVVSMVSSFYSLKWGTSYIATVVTLIFLMVVL